jgi:hypothetical protein
LLLIPPLEVRDDTDILTDGHMIEQADFLDDVSNVATQFDLVVVGNWRAVDDNLAVGELREPIEHRQQRRLPTPRWTDQRRRFALRNF